MPSLHGMPGTLAPESWRIGGERGIRTLAPVTPTYTLSRGAPSAKLGYFSMPNFTTYILLAEREGFEPPAPCGVTGFQDQLHKPLGHLSALPTLEPLEKSAYKVYQNMGLVSTNIEKDSFDIYLYFSMRVLIKFHICRA